MDCKKLAQNTVKDIAKKKKGWNARYGGTRF